MREKGEMGRRIKRKGERGGTDKEKERERGGGEEGKGVLNLSEF